MDSQQPLIRVQDVMNKDVCAAIMDDSIREAKDLMRTRGISGMPVVDREKVLLGIISVADIIHAMENNGLDDSVSEFMTVNPVFLHALDTVGYALQICRRFKYGRFPVVDEKLRVVGVLTASDIMTKLAQLLELDQVDELEEKTESIDFPAKKFECLLDSDNFDSAGLAASNIKKILTELGFAGAVIRRAAIAAYEAEMNVFIHAHGGKLSANVTPQVVTIIIEDYGPGILDIPLALQRGYSTATNEIRELGFGAGMGLPNIKKSADEFTIESSPQGTKLVIKIFV